MDRIEQQVSALARGSSRLAGGAAFNNKRKNLPDKLKQKK
jgi:hypothetical protein